MSDPSTIRKMRSAGMSWSDVAAAAGVSRDKARRLIDPAYDAIRRERNSTRHRIGSSGVPRSFNPPDEDIAARLAEIPPDTRDLTARLFGDPLPQRSALYQKQRA